MAIALSESVTKFQEICDSKLQGRLLTLLFHNYSQFL